MYLKNDLLSRMRNTIVFLRINKFFRGILVFKHTIALFNTTKLILTHLIVNFIQFFNFIQFNAFFAINSGKTFGNLTCPKESDQKRRITDLSSSPEKKYGPNPINTRTSCDLIHVQGSPSGETRGSRIIQKLWRRYIRGRRVSQDNLFNTDNVQDFAPRARSTGRAWWATLYVRTLTSYPPYPLSFYRGRGETPGGGGRPGDQYQRLMDQSRHQPSSLPPSPLKRTHVCERRTS